MYPELNVLEIPLVVALLVILIISVPVLLWNGLYHILNLVGISFGTELIIAELLASENALPNFMNGVILDIVALAVIAFYLLLIKFMIETMYSTIEQNISHMLCVELSMWTVSRIRKMISHCIYGQLLYWIVFIFVMIVWTQFINPVYPDTYGTLILFVLFGLLIVIGEVIKITEIGQQIIHLYFELIGGYDDGSMGRKLHISYKSVDEMFSEQELKLLFPDELYTDMIQDKE